MLFMKEKQQCLTLFGFRLSANDSVTKKRGLLSADWTTTLNADENKQQPFLL